ncbi:unnamed protein product [Pleuronectes platessa]|uniref:Uncharacterized protein n=1 Tax=Pleuronectes platessa TaxID=8262 RepID=A0A9N7VJP3_PLEPL|nr:unnamed protein product [Pleuronectes platessa]
MAEGSRKGQERVCRVWLVCCQTLCGSATAAADKRRGCAKDGAHRETSALISDGLTGCADRAVAQEEEEERCNGRTSCLKTRSKTRETTREGGRTKRRETTEGREVIWSSEREKAG